MGPDDNLKQNVRQSWADGQRWRSMSRFKGRTGAPPNTVYRLHAVRRNNVRWCRRTQISNVYIAGPAAGAVSRRVKYRGAREARQRRGDRIGAHNAKAARPSWGPAPARQNTNRATPVRTRAAKARHSGQGQPTSHRLRHRPHPHQLQTGHRRHQDQRTGESVTPQTVGAVG